MDISEEKFANLFFTRSADSVFHSALMFHKYGNIPTSVLEYLFFAQTPKTGAVFWLTFLENYNEQYDFVKNWFSDLKNINDEFDWNFQRAKLRSKFILFQTVNTEKAITVFKDEPIVTTQIRNAGIIWNNCIHILSESEYFPEKTPIKFELWKILISIKDGTESQIVATEKHLEQFRQIIFQRSNSPLIKKYLLNINNGSEERKYIDYFEKALETLINKNNLSKELNKKTIGEKIKDIFKV